MNSKHYKYCSVHMCLNSSVVTPEKLFIYVPKNLEIRYKWLTLARRDPNSFSITTTMHFCGDHFDLEKDMENYMEYKIMGRVQQVRMKPGSLPKIFPWQRKRNSTSDESLPGPVKILKTEPIQEKQSSIQSQCSETGNPEGYKFCVVPKCENSSNKTPNKLFLHVPSNKTMRNKWILQAKGDPTVISHNSTIWFCEDHFDMPNDMVNYMKYHIMGSVSQIRLRPGCVPSKFECQRESSVRNKESDVAGRRIDTILVKNESAGSGCEIAENLVKCYVPECKHFNQKNTCHFFCFPSDPTEKKKWVDLIGGPDREPSDGSMVCSCHFENMDRRNGPTLYSFKENTDLSSASSGNSISEFEEQIKMETHKIKIEDFDERCIDTEKCYSVCKKEIIDDDCQKFETSEQDNSNENSHRQPELEFAESKVEDKNILRMLIDENE